MTVDDGVATDTASVAVTVANVAPNIDANHATLVVAAGQTAANGGTFSDPGEDVVTLSASVGTVVDAGNGDWTWSFDTTGWISADRTVSITAADDDGDASSVTFEVLSEYVVTTTADSGPGSLRQAILDANAAPGKDAISFDIGTGGVQTIQPLTTLPTITDPLLIDGTTQPGFVGSPIIELDGTNAGTLAV